MTDAIIEKDFFGCIICLIIFSIAVRGRIIWLSKVGQVFLKHTDLLCGFLRISI